MCFVVGELGLYVQVYGCSSKMVLTQLQHPWQVLELVIENNELDYNTGEQNFGARIRKVVARTK